MKNLSLKLLEVQKEVTGIKKESTNPFFDSKYFDINRLLSVLKPVLVQQGLVLLQPMDMHEGKPTLTTTIIDTESGEQISSTTPLMEAKDVQKFGGSITYTRRYALQSLFALEAIDDDGNAAVGNKPAKKAAPKKAANKSATSF